MAFYRRLRDLREDAEKTQLEIAQYLETTAQYYGRYEKGECELPFFRAIQLADYYGVDLDYIAGRGEYAANSPVTLNQEEQNLVRGWRALNERNKGKLEFFLEELLKRQ